MPPSSAGDVTTTDRIASERPLHGFAKAAVVVGAGVAILLFGTVALLIVTLLAVWIVGELVVALAAARFGAVGIIKPFIERHTQLLALFFKALWLRRGKAFRVPLEEHEAPRFFSLLRELCARFEVPPPREVMIEMNASAWVALKGVRRGAKSTTLGIGYDLIAGLSEREIEAVLAHEMAHAKFVHRGYKRLVNEGTARATKLAGSLSALMEAYRRSKNELVVGEWILGIVDPLARLVVRLVSAYSRQDEFEADLGAAAICGAAPLRSTLIKLGHIEAKTARISWSERAAHLQQANGFTTWLATELSSNAADSSAAEESAFDRYSTHPSLADRLAALQGEDNAIDASSRGIELFANPDALGKRIVGELHALLAIEEQKAARKSAKWLKKLRRKNILRGRRQFAGVAFILGGVALIGGLNEHEPMWYFATAVMAIAGGTLWWSGRYVQKITLPVPTYESLRAAMEAEEESSAREAREKSLNAEVETLLQGLKRQQKIPTLRCAAEEALASCDYLRAFVVVKKWENLDRKNGEMKIVGAIALAGLRNAPLAGQLLSSALKNTGLKTTNLLWGAAWALIHFGDWAAAEPMLQSLHRIDPNSATYLGLLTLCQANLNKLQSATANAYRSVEAAPESLIRRELLVDLLIRSGRLAEAETVLATAGPAAETDTGLMQSYVWLSLLKRDFARADEGTTRLRARDIRGDCYVALGQMHETARCDDQAAIFYAEALTHGFYPVAELGLARLAFHRKDKVQARQRALAALDTTRTVAKKAVSPAGIFGAVVQLLWQLEAVTADAQAWICVLDPHRDLGPLNRHVLLTFARDESSARAYVLEIVRALRPSDPPPLPNVVQIQKAPKDRQPVGAVRCGVQQFWQ
jgi:Zn-dependent protease with chaperone function/tetratricopeptide (TPR) repeat protein